MIKPSKSPNEVQLAQIERKFGMFIHFGINTFLDQEWTDGTFDASCYSPTAIDTDNWVEAASLAGMKYIIFTAKHHEGFCLWDTEFTPYSVNNASNKVDVLRQLSDSCKKYNIKLGVYYSLWDRNWNNGCMRPEIGPALSPALSTQYTKYILNQIRELLLNYGEICEFWFDGGWVQPSSFWNIPEIYTLIKEHQPNCAMGVNWSIGLPGTPDTRWPNKPLSDLVGMMPAKGEFGIWPEDYAEGYPIRYFPSDFRLGDPHLPRADDPKLFEHANELYYMPFESTICLNDKWFYNTSDKGLKSIIELESLYLKATANQNILILNVPPNRNGVISTTDEERLSEFYQHIK